MLAETKTWLQNHRIAGTRYTLLSDFEIPDWAVWYHPNCYKAVTNFHQAKFSGNLLLHFERSLLFDEAQFIKQRIRQNDIINVIDLVETSGISSLPFIYELVVDEPLLGAYVAATVNEGVNQIAIKNLREALSNCTIEGDYAIDIKYDSMARNFNLESAQDLVLDISNDFKGSRFCNIFLLLHSSLGNSENPERMIRNIHNSMLPGDYLVVLQGIYKPGCETALISDYDKWYNYSQDEGQKVNKEICKLFNEESLFQVNWNVEFNGIEIVTTNQTPQQLFGVDIPENQPIRLLRSKRFFDGELKSMFEKVGLSIITVTYDQEGNNGMYFLKK